MTSTGDGPVAVPQWLHELRDAGELTREWEVVLGDVPRRLFLPGVMWPLDPEHGGYRVADRYADPEAWQRWAGTDTAIVTQWDDGAHAGPEPGEVPTSSASAPSLVAGMLADLDVRPGQQVLDVGVGTGWTTALLAARLGAENVAGVEIDPAVAEAAAVRLHAAGLDPLVVTGDGGDGWAPGRPYDRLQATYAVRDLPSAWVEQTRPGGVIVVPWATRFTNAGAVARLTVHADGSASGRFTRAAEFIASRSGREGWPDHADYLPPGGWPAGTSESATDIAAGDLWASPYGIAEFVVGLMVPDAVHSTGYTDGVGVAWFYSTCCRSWAVALFSSGGGEVYQGGGRRLWDEVEGAYRWWVRQGRPGHDRFGLTVRPGGHTVWLDHPDRPLPGPPRR